MQMKIRFFLALIAIGVVALGNDQIRPAAAADSNGGLCFLCDEWVSPQYQVLYHIDNESLINDHKGVQHSESTWGGCDIHQNYI